MCAVVKVLYLGKFRSVGMPVYGAIKVDTDVEKFKFDSHRQFTAGGCVSCGTVHEPAGKNSNQLLPNTILYLE